MGITDTLGLSKINLGVSWSSIGTGALIIIGVFAILLVSGVFTFFYYSSKAKKRAFKNQIPIYTDINGKISRIGIDKAKELFIPDTNISLYFLRDNKIYIARPTRAMGKDEYWYKILENGEWVNFNLSSKPDDDSLAIANYDHRDTRYAYVNLREIIKRNYKDKATQWWKEYSPLITFVVMAFIFLVGCWFLLFKIGNMIEDMAPLLEQQNTIAQAQLETARLMQNINSGVIKTT